MTERQIGSFTIPTYLYLTTEQRVKLEHLVRDERSDLANVVSQIVSDYLEQLPDVSVPEPSQVVDRSSEIRARRMELNRLRARRDASGSAAPAWLQSYIADLEAELKHLGG